MQLLLMSGAATKIRSVAIDVATERTTTYNISVEDLHNYFVGILVHNDGPTPEQLLGIEYANKSAHQSAQVIQGDQAKAGRDNLRSAGVDARVDIPTGDVTKPGNYPHAHGEGWSG